MPATAIVLLEVTLADPSEEDAFLAWWDEAKALLEARARMERATLAVMARGHYLATVELAFPGAWKIVAADRPWLELEKRRPAAQVAVREGRIWHREGVRDVTLTTLRRWLDERAAGTRDLVLLDTLPRATFDQKHLPGAVNVPAAEVDEATAAGAIGAKDRQVVIYCAHYG
jgi:hypothetical protein